MRINLAELRPGKPKTRNLELDRAEAQTASGPVGIRDLRAEFRFGLDPLGYVVRYRLRASADMTCVSTGKPVAATIDVADWISLRVQHPKDAHVVLDEAQMNVRFIESTELDIDGFALEIVELELPVYPRHPDADAAASEAVGGERTADGDSPFAALAKLLDQ